MQWAAIASLLWAIFGDRIKKLLDNLFKKTAKELPPADSFGSESDAAVALIDKALEKVKRRPLQKIALLFMRRNAVREGKLVQQLDEESKGELKAIESVAKSADE